MKLTVQRDALFSALQLVSRAVSSRATLPSLGGILLNASNGSLTLRATDMELGITQTLANVATAGEGSPMSSAACPAVR